MCSYFFYMFELIPKKDFKLDTSKTVLGLYEYVFIKGKKILARIDSGAVKSSIDVALAAELRLGPVIGSKIIRNVAGSTHRPLIDVSLKLCGRQIKASFTLQSRKHMNFKILIGQNILKQGFIIDPDKNDLIKK